MIYHVARRCFWAWLVLRSMLCVSKTQWDGIPYGAPIPSLSPEASFSRQAKIFIVGVVQISPEAPPAAPETSCLI